MQGKEGSLIVAASDVSIGGIFMFSHVIAD